MNASSPQASRPTPQPHLFDLTRDELASWIEAQGEKPSHADRIFRAIYKHNLTTFMGVQNLPDRLARKLEDTFSLSPLETERVLDSSDGTRKILFRLYDGARVETVCIPSGKRMTLCISSQVGCALGCRFCYTASMGPGRNLAVSEYISQVVEGLRQAPCEYSVVNIVFMGMGEPLVNFKNLLSTLSILTDHFGLQLGARRITVSTAGLSPQILALGQAFPVRLALSLHATTDEVRDDLMPINQRYNIANLFDTLQQFQELPGQRDVAVLLEYTLIRDVNDSLEDAHRLVELAQSIRSKVNLIPYNEHPGAPYRSPDDKVLWPFMQILQQAGVRVTKRITRGDDILAACGQLAISSPRSATTAP